MHKLGDDLGIRTEQIPRQDYLHQKIDIPVDGMDLSDFLKFIELFNELKLPFGLHVHQDKNGNALFHFRIFSVFYINHFFSERLHVFRDELINADTIVAFSALFPVMQGDIGIKICDGPPGKRINQSCPSDDGAQRAVNRLVPIQGRIFIRNRDPLFNLHGFPVIGYLIEQMRILTDLRQIYFVGQLGTVAKFRPLAVKEVLKGIFRGGAALAKLFNCDRNVE